MFSVKFKTTKQIKFCNRKYS